MKTEEIIDWWGDYQQHCKGNVALLHLRDFFEVERDIYTHIAREHQHKESFLSADADMAIFNDKYAKLCAEAARKMKTVRQKGQGKPISYGDSLRGEDWEEVYQEIHEVGFMKLLHYGAYLYQLARNEAQDNPIDWPSAAAKNAEHNRKVLVKLRADMKRVGGV